MSTAAADDTDVLVAETGETDDACALFIEAIAMHRHPARQTDPPQV